MLPFGRWERVAGLAASNLLRATLVGSGLEGKRQGEIRDGLSSVMRVQVRYVGRVQGVGFRATARSIAAAFAVTGFVRNEEDGSVLIEVQGAEAPVASVLDRLGVTMRRQIEASDRVDVAERAGESSFVIAR